MTYSSFSDDTDQPRIIDPPETKWHDARTSSYFGRTPETLYSPDPYQVKRM